MTALVILVPGLVIGAIAWGAVGILRQRGREEFTLTTALAFYAQVLLIAGVLAALSGIGVLLKLLLSTADPSYAYMTPASIPGYMGPSVSQQQEQDLILAVMLVGVGLVVAAGHWVLSRVVRRLPGGSPGWIASGALVAVTVLTALAGFLGAIVGGYEALVYFVVGGTPPPAFADPAGAALAFIPAWAIAMAILLRRVHRAPVGLPQPRS